jgi:hypothetical protein
MFKWLALEWWLWIIIFLIQALFIIFLLISSQPLFERFFVFKEVSMIKVHILTICDHCGGEAYIPVGEVETYKGEKYARYVACPLCQGSGNQAKRISPIDLIDLLNEAANKDPLEPDYQELAQEQPISQNQDSRDTAGI